MPNAALLLEQALEMGHDELGAIAEGDVDSAERLAMGRGHLINDAIKSRETIRLEELLNKLKELQRLQGRISSEARKLHSSLKDDLGRVKKQNKRLNGYGGTMRGNRMEKQVYIDKCG